MFPIRSIFNDPGKEFEVQLVVQISINWLDWNSRSPSRSYLVVNVRSDFVTGARASSHS